MMLKHFSWTCFPCATGSPHSIFHVSVRILQAVDLSEDFPEDCALHWALAAGCLIQDAFSVWLVLALLRVIVLRLNILSMPCNKDW